MMKRKIQMMAMLAHCMDVVGSSACRTVKISINMDIRIAPQSKIVRRPIRSTVKYSGTQPAANMMFCTPARRLTSDGDAPACAKVTVE